MNENRRKRIAVLVSQVDSRYQQALMKGILEEAFDADVNVLVFTTFIKDGTPDEYIKGEYNIYNIMNCDEIDGFIIIPDTIKDTPILRRLINDVKEKAPDKPFVSVDYSVDGIENFQNDNSEGVEQLIDHLIDVHGCKKINYLTGLKGHPHSISRLDGYIRSLTKHGIAVEEDRVEYGNFWHDTIDEYADKLINFPGGLPDAIGCCSDHTALFLAEALMNKGYKVPEDVKIVGYDYIGETSENFNGATTIRKTSDYAGREAVRKVVGILTGRKYEDPIKKSYEKIIIGQTCGCMQDIIKRTVPVVISSIYDDSESFYSGYNLMLETLISKKTTEDFFWGVDWYRTYIDDLDGIYFCLNTDWEGEDCAGTEIYRTEGFTNDIINIYTHDEKSHEVKWNYFKKQDMLPQIHDEETDPAVYYFVPSHFNNRAFGYAVVKYIGKAKVFNFEFACWMKYLNSALESLRRQILLRKLNDELEEMYLKIEKEAATDMLTGLNNRNVYNGFADAMFQKAVRDEQHIFVLFADLNNLKVINDNFGHHKGDAAIIIAATVIKRSCVGNERCFRIGGDEFVIIGCGNYDDDKMNGHMTFIRDEIDAYNKRSSEPYNISISIGALYTKCDDSMNIEKILADADKKMFLEKDLIKSSLSYIKNMMK